MFECVGDGQYADVARPLGCDIIEDSRSIAIADLDGDGRQDMVIANNADPPIFLFNRLRSVGNWLRIDVVGSDTANRDAIGTRVRVAIDDAGKERKLTRWVEAGLGFCTQSDLRLHFGVGQIDTIQSIEVKWPDGKTEVFSGDDVKQVINSSIRIKHGAGKIIRIPVDPKHEVAANISR
ncbi:MAG: ASPIC/UnbV domain-containing protein [Planctomycetota bacterium]|nr:ASPIC/UnbV domain-containing protein [Planctomycetota bacterium]